MRRVWERWISFWSEQEPATSLALFRIGVGVALGVALGSVIVHHDVRPLWTDVVDGGYDHVGTPWQFELLHVSVTATTVWSLIGLTSLSALLLLTGLGNRLGALLGLFGYDALTSLRTDAAGSYDPLMTNALWLLVLASSTATLSLDCRLRTGRWTSSSLVSAWPRKLCVYQLVVVYASTGLQKVSDTWLPGGGWSAIYYTLQQPTWQRWDMHWLAWVYPLTQLLTFLTWCFEVGSPLLLLVLWYRRTSDRPGRIRAFINRRPVRGAFILVGIGLHLSIFTLMAVGPFTWLILPFYFCLFRGDEWAYGTFPVTRTAAA